MAAIVATSVFSHKPCCACCENPIPSLTNTATVTEEMKDICGFDYQPGTRITVCLGCWIEYESEEEESDSEDERENPPAYYICMVLRNGYRDWCSAESLEDAQELYEMYRDGDENVLTAEVYDSSRRNRVYLDDDPQ